MGEAGTFVVAASFLRLLDVFPYSERGKKQAYTICREEDGDGD